MIQDYVVLVNLKNKVLGTAPKLETHSKNTPLHRGFSVFLFNPKGELLIQKRSKTKKTWPLTWSNSVCGHPMLNESNADAAKRRLQFELGIKANYIKEILPNYSYKAEKDGVMENEICPVLVAFSDKNPTLNKDEVEEVRWIDWDEFIADIKRHSGKYSVWCEEEAKLLAKNRKFLNLYKKYIFKLTH